MKSLIDIWNVFSCDQLLDRWVACTVVTGWHIFTCNEMMTIRRLTVRNHRINAVQFCDVAFVFFSHAMARGNSDERMAGCHYVIKNLGRLYTGNCIYRGFGRWDNRTSVLHATCFWRSSLIAWLTHISTVSLLMDRWTWSSWDHSSIFALHSNTHRLLCIASIAVESSASRTRLVTSTGKTLKSLLDADRSCER
jgi:hypothetical protein